MQVTASKLESRQWKLFVGVHNAKVRATFKTTLRCKGTCRGDCLLVHIDSRHCATGDSGHSKRWPPGSACHIKQSFTGSQAQPAQKSILLVRSEPAVLSDVFAKSLSPNFPVQFRSEIPIVGVVLTADHLDSTMLHRNVSFYSIARLSRHACSIFEWRKVITLEPRR